MLQSEEKHTLRESMQPFIEAEQLPSPRPRSDGSFGGVLRAGFVASRARDHYWWWFSGASRTGR